MFTRLDDHFWAHPKVLNCSDGAIALWVRALSWVGFQLTDGFVPHQCLRLLRGRKRDADRLVAAGLWERGECDGQLGYWFHDFTDWNNAATKEEVEKRRKRGHDRVIKHREKTTDWTELSPENTSNPGGHGDKLVDHSPTPHAPKADTLPVLAEETTNSTLPATSPTHSTPAPAAAPTPAITPTTQPKLNSPAGIAPSKPGPLPAVCGQSPADWSTMDDPRCRKHAGLPRGKVPPCWACGQVRLWFIQQALAVKQAQRNMVAACKYCDERGLAETSDEFGKRLLIRCDHDGFIAMIVTLSVWISHLSQSMQSMTPKIKGSKAFLKQVFDDSLSTPTRGLSYKYRGTTSPMGGGKLWYYPHFCRLMPVASLLKP